MASTTFLALTNKLLRRLNEVELTQSDFPSARGVQAFAKDAINAAVAKISNQNFEWPFNATSTTQLLTVGTNTYSFPSNLKYADWNSFHVVKDDTLGTNTTHLKLISKDVWEDFYKDTDLNATTDGVNVPLFVFKGNTYGFGVTPSPNLAYTIRYDYHMTFTSLDLYSDVSTIPPNFDEVIIQAGLYHFYMFRDNTEQADNAKGEYATLFAQMKSQMGIIEDRVVSTMLPFGSGLRYASQAVYSGGSGD